MTSLVIEAEGNGEVMRFHHISRVHAEYNSAIPDRAPGIAELYSARWSVYTGTEVEIQGMDGDQVGL